MGWLARKDKDKKWGRNPKPEGRFLFISFMAATIFFLGLIWTEKVHVYLAILISWSFTNLILMALDKITAKIGWIRIPEYNLLLNTILGGFPGTVLGMFILRHKVRKVHFWVILLISVLLHLIIASLYIIFTH